MQHIVRIVFFLSVIPTFSQEILQDFLGKKKLIGTVIDGSTKAILPNTHIINLSTVEATISTFDGKFQIPVEVNDTLYFSYVGYQSLKLKVTHDLLKGNSLEIALYQKPFELNEIKLKPYKLVGVLEVDAKLVPTNPYDNIHINGMPQTFETGAPMSRLYNSPIDAVFHPVDFMYELFGKKPQQLRKLKKLKTEDNLRELLEKKANREVLMEFLELDRAQLNSLLDYCNYSEYFINNANDLQIIEAVLECYENFKALKKGSTIRQE